MTDELLFGAIADEFLAFIGDASLAAHNAGFDIAFINAEGSARPTRRNSPVYGARTNRRTDVLMAKQKPQAYRRPLKRPAAWTICEHLVLYGIGPKYSNPSIGITIAAITITAVLNCFSLRLLPRLRISTMGGACTGLRAICALQLGQDRRTPSGTRTRRMSFNLPPTGIEPSVRTRLHEWSIAALSGRVQDVAHHPHTNRMQGCWAASQAN